MTAAEAFSDAKKWYPSMEPILARLATEIRSWQLGDDRDSGWIGCNDLHAAVSRIKAELDRIGQDVDVGITWNLNAPLALAHPNAAGRGARATGIGSGRNWISLAVRGDLVVEVGVVQRPLEAVAQ